MIEISLTQFVDFTIRTGTTRVTKVRELKSRGNQYDPKIDFWRILRESIIEHCRSNSKERLEIREVLKKVLSDKKIKNFPLRIEGYNKFRSKKKISWFEPPRAEWEHSGVNVRVNPELGLNINGRRTIVKLYFKNDPLSKSRVEITRLLLATALKSDLDEEIDFAVLDVPRGKIYNSPKPDPSLPPLLLSEASALEVIWNGI